MLQRKLTRNLSAIEFFLFIKPTFFSFVAEYRIIITKLPNHYCILYMSRRRIANDL
jgi:hypothetical protein